MKKIVRISLILVNALVLSGPIFGSQNPQETIEIPSDYASVVPVIDGGKLKKDCLVTFDELYKKSLESNGYLIVAKQEGQEFVMPLVSYKISSPENCEFFVAGINQVNAQNIEFFNITQNVKDFLQRTPEAKLYDLGERAFKGDLQVLSDLRLMAQPSHPVAHTSTMVVPVYVPVSVPFLVPFFASVPAPVPVPMLRQPMLRQPMLRQPMQRQPMQRQPMQRQPMQRQQRGRLGSRRIIPSITEIREESLEEKKALAESIILKAINDSVVQVEEENERTIEGIIQDEIGIMQDEVIQEEALKIFNECKEVEEKRKIKKDKEKEEKIIDGFIKDDFIGNLLDEIIKEEAPQILNELKIEKQQRKELESQSKNAGQAMSRQMTAAEIVEQDKKAALALAVNKQDDDEVISVDQADKDSKQKKNKKKKSKTEEQKAQEAQEELLMQQMQKEIDNGPIVKIPLLAVNICKNLEKSTVAQLTHSISELDKLMKLYKNEKGYDSESSYTSILSVIAYSLESLCEIVKNINELKNNHTFSFNSKLKIFDTEYFVLNLLANFTLLDKMHNEVKANGKFLIEEKKHRENMQKALLSIAQAYNFLKTEADCIYLNIMCSIKKISQEDQDNIIVKNQLYKIINFLDKEKNKDFIDGELMKNISEIDEKIKIRNFGGTDLVYSVEKIVLFLKEMCGEILQNREFTYAEFQQLAMYSAYAKNKADNCVLHAKLISPLLFHVRNIYLIFSCIKEIQNSSEVIDDSDVQLLSIFEEDELFLEEFLKVFITLEELYKNQLLLNRLIGTEKELRTFLIFFQSFYNEFLITHQDILASNIGYFLAKEQNQDKKNALKKIFHVFVCKIYKKAFTEEQVNMYLK